MPFYTYDYERLSRAAARLREERWRCHAPIGAFAVTEDDGTVGARPPEKPGTELLHTGEIWSGYDRYLWLDAEAEVPQDFDGPVWGRFDFGRTGGGGNSGFESLLFVNGKPWQAVDTNHQEAPLHARAGETLRLQLRLWSGLVGGGRPHPNDCKFRMAELAVLDEGADSLCYWLTCLLGAYDILDENAHVP